MTTPEALKQVATEVKGGGKRTETVRTLLSWFGAQRRGINVQVDITIALARLGLQTVPPFDAVALDWEIEFQVAAGTSTTLPAVENAGPDTTAVRAEAGLTVGLLASADRLPVCVSRDSDIREARSLMLVHDYSQLPVVNGRLVVGMFSWKSMGEALALGRECNRVGDCMSKDPLLLDASTPLLDAVEQIIAREVAVISRNGKLVGVVTNSDLSQKFHESARAYLMLGTIEARLRALISEFPEDVLRLARVETTAPAASAALTDVSGMTFGEYVRLLQRDEGWTLFSTTLDRTVVVKLLDEVRAIRNDVMHFHTDPLDEHDLDKLRNAARLLDLLIGSRARQLAVSR